MMKLTIALRFYAIGSFYEAIGDMFGVSKSTVQSIVSEVSFLISTMLRRRYIHMPSTPQELLDAKVDFMRLSAFPICIAAVDGTHVAVQSFGGNDAELYRNRKTFFSLNCQIAVSADVIHFNRFGKNRRIWYVCIINHSITHIFIVCAIYERSEKKNFQSKLDEFVSNLFIEEDNEAKILITLKIYDDYYDNINIYKNWQIKYINKNGIYVLQHELNCVLICIKRRS